MTIKRITGAVAGAMVIPGHNHGLHQRIPVWNASGPLKAPAYPTRAIDLLKNPGQLNAVERLALNRALNRAGIGDACGEITGELDRDEKDSQLGRFDQESNDDEPEGTEDQPTPTAGLAARIPEDDEASPQVPASGP